MINSRGKIMAQTGKTTGFARNLEQHVIVPDEYQMPADEVYVRGDQRTGDLILSESPGGWRAFFAALDEDRFPDDFLEDRAQGINESREEL
jgi:antitoxin VapB